MGINIKWQGEEAFIKALNRARAESEPDVKQVIKDTVIDVEADSLRNIKPHRDSGATQDSIDRRISGLEGEVGYKVEYAPHNEYGHRRKKKDGTTIHVSGIKYLHDAVEKNREPHHQALNEVVRKLTGN